MKYTYKEVKEKGRTFRGIYF